MSQISPTRDNRRSSAPSQRAGPLAIGLLLVICVGCRTLRQGPIPESVAACRRLSAQGHNAMERGDWRRAESLLAQAVKSCPGDSDARRLYAETLWRRGANRAAVSQLEEARRFAPDDLAMTVRGGEMHLGLGRTDLALSSVSQALSIDPRYGPAWALKAKVSESAGDVRQALADYQRALVFAPEDVDIQLSVAEAYRKLGQPDRSLAVLQSLAERYPPGEEPQHVLSLQGALLASLGRHDDAANAIELAIQRGPADAELWQRLANAQAAAGRPADARISTARAAALAKNRPVEKMLDSPNLGVETAMTPSGSKRY